MKVDRHIYCRNCFVTFCFVHEIVLVQECVIYEHNFYSLKWISFLVEVLPVSFTSYDNTSFYFARSFWSFWRTITLSLDYSARQFYDLYICRFWAIPFKFYFRKLLVGSSLMTIDGEPRVKQIRNVREPGEFIYNSNITCIQVSKDVRYNLKQCLIRKRIKECTSFSSKNKHLNFGHTVFDQGGTSNEHLTCR